MSDNSFTITAACAADTPLINTLLDEAFGLERRVKTAYRLREGSSPVDQLSLVAWHEGRLAGTVQFWPLRIGHRWDALLLGPLAVAPWFRGARCGIALMERGIAVARERGFSRVVLVGDAPYYGKVGFKRVPDGVLSMPGPVDPDRLLCCELKEGAMHGVSGLLLSPSVSASLSEPGEPEQHQQNAEAEQC
jgi:predicted N-acetyltransferase YhbS